MLETKILTAYILSKIEYEIDEEQLSNPEIRFALYSQYELTIKVTKFY